MRVFRFASSRRSSSAVLGFSALVASLSLSASSFAAVPTGWSPLSSIDGGTSSIGSSVATTDTIAAVGAPFATATSGATPTGAVFVYSSAGGTWSSQRVAAPTPIDNGNFGTSVAASGGLLAVGATGTPPAAYVFGADGGTYAPLQTWSDPASDKNASFGGSVAVLDGQGGTSYVAVAAPPGSSNPNGIVYVSRSIGGGAWSTPVEITDTSASAFGISVGFAGNGDLLVGDPGTGAGQVLVYAPEADGGWAPEGTLPFALDGGTVQQFGNAVATSDTLAVVTAPSTANAAGTYNGAVFVFEADAGAWQQQAVLTGAAAESFANFAPSIGNGFIAVGSAVNTASSGSGQVDVWAQNGGEWVSVPSSTLVGDSYYGQAVGVVSGTLFIGDTSAAGAASVSDVTSSLYLESAIYPDGGVPGDASPGTTDGSAPLADGSAGSVDGSSGGGSGGDAAAGGGGDGGGGGEPVTGTSSSSGCSCTSGAGSDPNDLFALFGESGLVVLAWRRRRSRATPSRSSC